LEFASATPVRVTTAIYLEANSSHHEVEYLYFNLDSQTFSGVSANGEAHRLSD
jgi:hypothetical protein